jgi:TonB family protein
MIPRTLVPVDVRPVTKDEAKKATHHRVTTYMDDRTVVPSGLSEAPPLDGKTTIPSHLPLDVLVNRTLVPRGMPALPIQRTRPLTEFVPVNILDERMVVPVFIEPLTEEEAEAPERAPAMTAELREIVQPDIFTTGDANLLIEPEEKKDAKSDALTRVLSVLVHVAVIVFLILTPKLFPPHVPTEDEIAAAKRALGNIVYLPPELPVPAAPHPKMNVTPETLKKVAPPVEKPVVPAPVTPERPPADLPESPKPKLAVAPTPPPSVPTPPAPSQLQPIVPVQPSNRLKLDLPSATPGKALDDQMQNAAHEGRGQAPIIGSGPPATGGRGIGMGYGVDILSDTQGVDFRDYITRLLATLKRNWYAVMPESANMGERGVVYTTFSINPDGSVSLPDPTLERTSGKEPLDNAAMAAIHASNPFEPLPKQFHGPNLKLRIVFLYNVHPEEIGLH